MIRAVVLAVAVLLALGLLLGASMRGLVALLIAPRPAPEEIAPAKIVTELTEVGTGLLESIALDSQGNMFLSVMSAGEIWKVNASGERELYAKLPAGDFDLLRLRGYVAALVFTPDEELYANLAATDPAHRGVWRIEARGKSRRIAALPPEALPNGIASDALGNLFVADSGQGRIWRIARGGDRAEPWLVHPLLSRRAYTLLPGPNGIQVHDDAIYVTNTSRRTIVRADVKPDGMPGDVTVHADDIPADDFAFDEAGNIYATTHPLNTVVRIGPNGTGRAIVATAEQGVRGPTAAVFGVRPADRNSLFVACDGDYLFPFERQTPRVVQLDLAVPGHR